ncbi:MAG: DUF484 family protein [Gammaproteobacteria bacterium]
MTTRTQGLYQGTVSEEAIEKYLRAHSDFFERHTQLLAVLKIPHPARGAVSLIEKQVDVLRAKNRQMERKLIDLVQVARDNEGLSTRLHRLALGLMEAENLDDALATSKELLRNDFQSAQVVIKLFAGENEKDKPKVHFVRRDDPELSMFKELFDSRRPVCGQLTASEAKYLFGRHSGEISSAVMIPLYATHDIGILALGSQQKDRFHTGMGTLFLGYLGELISRAVTTHIEP